MADETTEKTTATSSDKGPDGAVSSTTSNDTASGTYLGRERIYTRFTSISADNVAAIVAETQVAHAFNAGQIKYLRDYWRGNAPILNRTKDVRPEICNKVVENRADEIMSFKVGYQLSEPVQYIFRRGSDDVSDDKAAQMTLLNTLMFVEGKEELDRDLFEWMCQCGVGYRMVEPDRDEVSEHDMDAEDFDGTAPFNISVPDPRQCYVVYSKMYHHRALAAVWVGIDEDDSYIYTVYTKESVYKVKDGNLVSEDVNGIGFIPIIEYDLNSTRQGVFEKALPLLDAINNLDSNRLDGVEQVVQALYLFKNCAVDEETFLSMLNLGAISVTATDGMQGDVTLITNNLDQQQSQTVKEDMISALHEICGMPNMNAGGANDTGSAVYMRDGYGIAEAHAKTYELQFKKAEREFLKVVLAICDASEEKIDLTLREIDVAFNRRNYDNGLTKAQMLTTMLDTGKVDPLDCFKSCGLFTDPEAAYARALAYMDKQEEKAREQFGQQQAAAAGQVDGADPDAKTLSDHDGDGLAAEDNHGRTDVKSGVSVTTQK